MKIIRLNGIVPELIDFDYNTIREEKEKYEKKGKIDKANAFSEVLKGLNDNSSFDDIENQINSIIDSNADKIKELKQEIKKLKSQNYFLSEFSQRERNESATIAMIASI